MKRVTGVVFALVLGVVFCSVAWAKKKPQKVYDYTVKSNDGKKVSLKKYSGKVLLLVNTASQCGYTYQYAGMQKVYDKYKKQGLVVLAFPANNFGGQEPGTNKQIRAFCSKKYKVEFPLFAKISVKGKDKHPLYAFLTSKTHHPKTGGEISWNFNKFLVGRKGKVIARFGSGDDPDGKKVVAAIQKALKKK